LAILGHLEHPHAADPEPVSSVDFEAVVRTIPAGPVIPQLSEAYIHKYLRDMQLLGLLEQPVRARQDASGSAVASCE
jgi:hypothetical protein